MIAAIVLLTIAIIAVAVLDARQAPVERARLAAQPSAPLPASRYLFGLLVVAVILWIMTA